MLTALWRTSRTTWRGALVCVAVVCAATSGAVQADAQVLPSVERAQLPNGIALVFRSNPAAESVAISAFVNIPASCETQQTAGIRSLTQAMLLHRRAGPDHTGPVEELSQYGAVVGQSVHPDCTQVSVVALAEYADECLRPLREILFGSEFDWTHFRAERVAHAKEIERLEENGLAYAAYLAYAYMFAGTSCAWPAAGTRLGIQRTRQAEVTRFYKRYYRPNRTVLAISGPMEFAECRAAVEHAFGAVLPGPDEQASGDDERLPDREPLYIHRPWPSENAAILMLTRAPGPSDPRYPAIEVLTAVLGGGQGGVLWQTLRAEKALVYAVDAVVSASDVCGTLQIAATCDAARAGDVYVAIRDEIASLQKSPPSSKQVGRAISYLAGRYFLNQQRNLHATGLMGRFELLAPGGGPELLEATFDRIGQVTPEQVQKAAQECLTPAVWVQVGGLPPTGQ